MMLNQYERFGMTEERYKQLEGASPSCLTDEEVENGWMFIQIQQWSWRKYEDRLTNVNWDHGPKDYYFK